MESQNSSTHYESDVGGRVAKKGRERSATDPTQNKLAVNVPAVGTTGSPLSTKNSLQDRLFTTLFQQILPTQDTPVEVPKRANRSKNAVERPNFSLPMMSNNFRRFNARIGVVFVFQGKLTRLFSWKTPSQTLSFLAVFSLLCLEPNLLPSLPLVMCLLFIMVPAFYLRHPPPPNSQVTERFAAQGPASAPPPNIKPAPDMSKAFFRNMRDLQNSMEDFSVVHDQLVKFVAPLTNFSDERVSSALFLSIMATASFTYLLSFIIPWRLLVLFSGWAVVGSSHPIAIALISTIDTKSVKIAIKQGQIRIQRWIMEDIVLDEAPEVREVEVFELQRHRYGTEWETWLYSTSPYVPQSASRVSGDRPKGTRFFEDVQAPKGWEWSDKKWSLDLLSQQWVEDRMITAVEVETDGERWVYDIGASDSLGDESQESNSEHKRVPSREGAKEVQVIPPGGVGEWRRRRWTRLVKRKMLREAPELKS